MSARYFVDIAVYQSTPSTSVKSSKRNLLRRSNNSTACLPNSHSNHTKTYTMDEFVARTKNVKSIQILVSLSFQGSLPKKDNSHKRDPKAYRPSICQSNLYVSQAAYCPGSSRLGRVGTGGSNFSLKEQKKKLIFYYFQNDPSDLKEKNTFDLTYDFKSIDRVRQFVVLYLQHDLG